MKTYFNDPRPMPKETEWECCDCRNDVKITFLGVYPHGTTSINFCPVCGAKAIGSAASFRKIDGPIA